MDIRKHLVSCYCVEIQMRRKIKFFEIRLDNISMTYIRRLKFSLNELKEGEIYAKYR